MRWLRSFWIAVLPVALLGGCRKSAQTESHEALVKEAIVSMRNTASSLNNATDATSAEQAVKVVQRETQNLQTLRQRLAGLGKASSSERERVKRHSQDMIAASDALSQAVAAAVGKIQAGRLPPELGRRLAATTHDYGKAMVDYGHQTTPLFE
jgi:hypothetical protein